MASRLYNPFLANRTCTGTNHAKPQLAPPARSARSHHVHLIQSASMDSTLPCRLLPPPPSSTRLRPNGARTLPGDQGCGRTRPARSSSRTWSRRRNGAGRLRVDALFGDGGDGFRAVKRILKLNSAIQNRSVRELLELVGDECQDFFSNLPPFSIAQISKNMLLLLHEIMLRHQVSFVLKPTKDQGFDLGIKWSLEWQGKKLPWDLDCNVSTTHVYSGLLLFSQVNKACVSLLQRIIQTIHENLDTVIFIVTNKILPEGALDEKETSTIIACAIISLAVMLLFFIMFKNL